MTSKNFFSQAMATVIGGGLAGCEAAWQLLRAGVNVDLIEARPAIQSPAHSSLLFAELVCSNSLRSDAKPPATATASGLLKTEMRHIGSLILDAADKFCVPAGTALAVDRMAFAWSVTSSLVLHPRFRVRRYPVEKLPKEPCILATGPLTSSKLAMELKQHLGGGLYFYDAIAPIVQGETIDRGKVFFGARHEPNSRDYVNCPLNREQYDHLVQALRTGRQVPRHSFEEERFFEGCLPIEIMAIRGDDVLAYGPLRPVGLIDPKTGRRPYAVVQLRAENQAKTSYNMVGFQTRLVHSEQKRIFRLIPGLEQARFDRLGSIHRNSYIDSPRVLGPRLEIKSAKNIKVAGQIAGVEGYMESAALGQIAGLLMAAELKGVSLEPPPISTALGALFNHVTRQRCEQERFVPSNITFGLIPLPEEKMRNKAKRREAICEHAIADLEKWWNCAQELLC